MIPKQQEMDGIVRQIYEAIETEAFFGSTLLVLAGDHGMNDAGNHGGSAPGETSAALVFISPKLKTINSGSRSPAPFEEDYRYHTFVEQSDIAPTLGALLGFPVPRNNLGAVIANFLPFWPNSESKWQPGYAVANGIYLGNDRIQILLQNARQILNVVTATFPSFEGGDNSKNCHQLSEDVDKLSCEWKALTQDLKDLKVREEDTEAWQVSISKWLKEAHELMSSTASNYDISKLIVGQVLAMLASVIAIAAAWTSLANSLRTSLPLLVVIISYGIIMGASSYVEEEQHFWYWMTTAWLGLLWIKRYVRLVPL